MIELQRDDAATDENRPVRLGGPGDHFIAGDQVFGAWDVEGPRPSIMATDLPTARVTPATAMPAQPLLSTTRSQNFIINSLLTTDP